MLQTLLLLAYANYLVDVPQERNKLTHALNGNPKWLMSHKKRNKLMHALNGNPKRLHTIEGSGRMPIFFPCTVKIGSLFLQTCDTSMKCEKTSHEKRVVGGLARRKMNTILPCAKVPQDPS
eukprot:g70374.t1